jgi:hypothetical protein
MKVMQDGKPNLFLVMEKHQQGLIRRASGDTGA